MRRRNTPPGLPEPLGTRRRGWYHAIPAASGESDREGLVIYNPWDRHIWLYAPAPAGEDCFAPYRPTPRPYNARLMD